MEGGRRYSNLDVIKSTLLTPAKSLCSMKTAMPIKWFREILRLAAFLHRGIDEAAGEITSPVDPHRVFFLFALCISNVECGTQPAYSIPCSAQAVWYYAEIFVNGKRSKLVRDGAPMMRL